MARTRIVTDSSADLTPEVLAELEITVVPARRIAPTEGKVPLRTFQYISQVAGSVENIGASTVAMPVGFGLLAAATVIAAPLWLMAGVLIAAQWPARAIRHL